MKKLFLCLALLTSACAYRVDLMKANAISMKHREMPDNMKLVETGDISSRFCMENFKSSSGKEIGMIDEVVKVAENEHKIDFILHANIYSEGNCVAIEGEGARLEK